MISLDFTFCFNFHFRRNFDNNEDERSTWDYSTFQASRTGNPFSPKVHQVLIHSTHSKSYWMSTY